MIRSDITIEETMRDLPLLASQRKDESLTTTASSNKKRKRAAPSKFQIVLGGLLVGYIARSGSLAATLYYKPRAVVTYSDVNTVVAVEDPKTMSAEKLGRMSSSSSSNPDRNSWSFIFACITCNFSAILSMILRFWLMSLLCINQHIVDAVYGFWFPKYLSVCYTKRDILTLSSFHLLMGFICGSDLAGVTCNVITPAVIGTTATMVISQGPLSSSSTSLLLNSMGHVVILQVGIQLYISMIVKPRQKVEDSTIVVVERQGGVLPQTV